MSTTPAEPSEEDLRAAYEAELNRISSSEMMFQTVVSLLNIGARRMGLLGPQDPQTSAEVDLEQVRDAIDGVRALLPILERRNPTELKPMRDALSQLQMAFARHAPARDPAQESPEGSTPNSAPQPAGESQRTPEQPPEKSDQGPAEASGRLWVPGR